MNAGQYEGLMARLGEILDRMPERPGTVAPEPARYGPGPLPGADPLGAFARVALLRMLGMLDGWIEGARENHDAMGHKYENRGEECWTQFHPADIRNMINDVARELGLAEFPAPAKPKEDEVR